MLLCPCLKSKETVTVVLAAVWFLGNSNTASELGLHHTASSCAYVNWIAWTHSCKGEQDTRAAEKEISGHPANIAVFLASSAIIMGFLASRWFTGWGYDIPFTFQDEICVLWLHAAEVPDCVAPKVRKAVQACNSYSNPGVACSVQLHHWLFILFLNIK